MAFFVADKLRLDPPMYTPEVASQGSLSLPVYNEKARKPRPQARASAKALRLWNCTLNAMVRGLLNTFRYAEEKHRSNFFVPVGRAGSALWWIRGLSASREVFMGRKTPPKNTRPKYPHNAIEHAQDMGFIIAMLGFFEQQARKQELDAVAVVLGQTKEETIQIAARHFSRKPAAVTQEMFRTVDTVSTFMAVLLSSTATPAKHQQALRDFIQASEESEDDEPSGGA
jgi:hypothetical protein